MNLLEEEELKRLESLLTESHSSHLSQHSPKAKCTQQDCLGLNWGIDWLKRKHGYRAVCSIRRRTNSPS
jgi:hypothetical protein